MSGPQPGPQHEVHDPDEVRHRNLLLRIGLPRDPSGSRHVAAFVVVTVATVLLTRALLAATGYPQVGGSSGLHIAHVLWGGLLMGIALVLAMSYAGPVVRPVVSLVGGVGFGLFVDEIGKFLTADNDYFFAPTPALIYVVAIALLLLGEALQRRRGWHSSESLAAAVDEAVAGVAGGLSERARDRALRRLPDEHVAGAPEARALIEAIPADEQELPSLVGAAARRVESAARRLLSGARWLGPVVAGLVVVAALAAIGWAIALHDPMFAAIGVGVGGVAQLVLAGIGVRSSRGVPAFEWYRRSLYVGLLVTQPFLFRLVEWAATVGLVVGIVLLTLVAAELYVLTGGDARAQGEVAPHR
ncbi:hypothetical protein [Cellulomonas sp. HZM]|uniref:hypothetical protein n=1 Tax=Cellulomonas sp. HZM TaxID=1454010 RepID=UPI000AAC5908|nr:hypothetical protein [Cellulomonas sp. HZM]